MVKAELAEKSLQQARDMEEQRRFFKGLLEESQSGFKGKSCPPLNLDICDSNTRRSQIGLDPAATKLELPSRNECEGDQDNGAIEDSDDSISSVESCDMYNQGARINRPNIFGYVEPLDSDSEVEEENSGDEEEVMQSARFGNPHLDQDGDQKCEFCAEKWHPLSACPTYFLYKHRIQMQNLRLN